MCPISFKITNHSNVPVHEVRVLFLTLCIGNIPMHIILSGSFSQQSTPFDHIHLYRNIQRLLYENMYSIYLYNLRTY